MDRATHQLLNRIAAHGNLVTIDGFDPVYDQATADRAIAAGLAQLDTGNGWDTTTRLRLTRAGRMALGLPVPTRLIDRVRVWWSAANGR